MCTAAAAKPHIAAGRHPSRRRSRGSLLSGRGHELRTLENSSLAAFQGMLPTAHVSAGVAAAASSPSLVAAAPALTTWLRPNNVLDCPDCHVMIGRAASPFAPSGRSIVRKSNQQRRRRDWNESLLLVQKEPRRHGGSVKRRLWKINRRSSQNWTSETPVGGPCSLS